MGERILLFGESNSLGGILRGPDDGRGVRARIVFLPPGRFDWNGPAGMYREMVAAFPPDGVLSLRVDVSELPMERREAVVVKALDALDAAAGQGSVVLVGVGGGADLALAASKEEKRVRGLVLIDGPAYPDWLSQLEWVVKSRISPGFLRREAKKYRCRGMRLPADSSEALSGLIPESRKFPGREEVTSLLRGVTDAGGELLVIATGGSASSCSGRRHFFRNFQAPSIRARTTFHHFPKSDSTFSATRAPLIAAVAEWLARIQSSEPSISPS